MNPCKSIIYLHVCICFKALSTHAESLQQIVSGAKSLSCEHVVFFKNKVFHP